MKRIKLICLLLCAVMVTVLLSGCRKETKIPFTDIKWNASEEDVKNAEGEPKEVYNSVYNGNAYAYDKTFLTFDGTVKYMFSEDGKLASVAWAFQSTDPEQVSRVYKIIQDREIQDNGRSEFSNTNETAYGDVWYLDDVDILITRLDMVEGSALQYAYINKDFSAK